MRLRIGTFKSGTRFDRSLAPVNGAAHLGVNLSMREEVSDLKSVVEFFVNHAYCADGEPWYRVEDNKIFTYKRYGGFFIGKGGHTANALAKAAGLKRIEVVILD